MFNPYSIILGLFIVSGFVATVWGLRVIMVARKTQHWPSVAGMIEESSLSSAEDDLLPHILYSYTWEKQQYRQLMKFPGDITPGQEFARSCVNRFPVGAHVQVYCNPDNPEISTLEPGPGKGDWLILFIGIFMFLFGLLLFISNAL